MFGFGILVSLWPFHSWAPLGYASAPTAIAMLHAGVLKKFGLYGLIRIALPLLPGEAARWMEILAFLCLGNIIYCGLVAMRQRDLNLLIGNSSVAHMGFAFLGLASLSIIGFSGTVLIMVAHGFLAALTFALSGYLDEQLNTLELHRHGRIAAPSALHRDGHDHGDAGRLRAARFRQFSRRNDGACLAVGTGSRWCVVIAIWGALVIAGVYMLRAIREIWHGEKAWPALSDPANVWRKLPYGLLLACLILLGCYPRLLTDHITASVEPVARMASGQPALESKPAPESLRPSVLRSTPQAVIPQSVK